jgi:hypothetical protein
LQASRERLTRTATRTERRSRRVVLVRARSGVAALRKGEAEADEYCFRLVHVNPYGQIVTWRRVDHDLDRLRARENAKRTI